MKILIIDCYDSFTYNLYQYFNILNCDVKVIYFDNPDILKIVKNYDNIVLSPGPGNPDDYPILYEIIAEKINSKILGVCLGMQTIVKYFGGKVVKAPMPVHGYTSKLLHNSKDIFENIPNRINVMRYHSLIIDRDSISQDIEIIGKTYSEVPMAIHHNNYNIWGMQFHPEAYLTEYGIYMLQNWSKL